jgi:hypothetical protein
MLANVGKDTEKLDHSHTTNGNVKWHNLLLKIVWQFFLNEACNYHMIHQLYHGHSCQKKMETYIPAKTCAWTSIVDLFIITPNWRQSRCASPGEWLNVLWCYSAMHRNEILRHKQTWMNLQGIMLEKKVNPLQIQSCMVPFTGYFWNDTILKLSRVVVPMVRDWVEGWKRGGFGR